MTNVWFTSDLHLGHKNILKYTNRPFQTLDEHNEGIIQRWNERVAPGDLVYVLGDVAFCKLEPAVEFIRRLKGTKHLIKGNHDHLVNKDAFRACFNSIRDMETARIVDPDAPHGKQRIVLCHYAMRIWDQIHHGAWHLYGHSHGGLPESTQRCFDVGVDTHDCYPWSYEEVKAKMATKTFIPEDHHGTHDE